MLFSVFLILISSSIIFLVCLLSSLLILLNVHSIIFCDISFFLLFLYLKPWFFLCKFHTWFYWSTFLPWWLQIFSSFWCGCLQTSWTFPSMCAFVCSHFSCALCLVDRLFICVFLLIHCCFLGKRVTFPPVLSWRQFLWEESWLVLSYFHHFKSQILDYFHIINRGSSGF